MRINFNGVGEAGDSCASKYKLYEYPIERSRDVTDYCLNLVGTDCDNEETAHTDTAGNELGGKHIHSEALNDIAGSIDDASKFRGLIERSSPYPAPIHKSTVLDLLA